MKSKLGAHLEKGGVHFAVWAPNALAVSVIGDFNEWRGSPMEQKQVWELFVPDIGEGERYKYAVHTKEGTVHKADPYAYYAEVRPLNASKVFDVHRYQFQHPKPKLNGPMNIYELHLGSWKRGTYRELAPQIANYCKEMGYTHIELLPVMEHPLDESWGYQVTGFFAATSRYGTPEDFQFFIDHLHGEGLGVLLDWVPGHFPLDDFGLANFDGTPLYENGFHPKWTTATFDYRKPEVCQFLIESALFWLTTMGADGLRVDAVSSILYLDHERDEWTPNIHGGNENLEGIAFIKELNRVVHEEVPEAIMIAEESTSFPGVCDRDGLGFDMKWNMGWMNDTLAYFSTDPEHRHTCHEHLTWGLTYAFSERFVLPFSHDEVVHEKRSLLSKMPGDIDEQFAGLRLLYSYKICQPGKQLLFMGGEFGQVTEWNCKEELPWHLLEEEHHKGVHALIKDLNQFYLEHSALWERDFESSGFEWIDFSDEENGVISYKRKSGSEELICIHNFHPQRHKNYALPLEGTFQVLFNTDIYGGGKSIGPIQTTPLGIELEIPPLATLILSLEN